MLKSILLVFVCLFSVTSFAQSVTETTTQLEQPGVLSNIQVEGSLQTPGVLGSGRTAFGISATKKITIDQTLGLRGLAQSSPSSEIGNSLGIVWRRHLLVSANVLPFLEADLSHSRVRPAVGSDLVSTTFGLALGFGVKVVGSLRVGALLGADLLANDIASSRKTRVGDLTLVDRGSVFMGIDL